MLAWVMNLGFAASLTSDSPPDQEGLEYTLPVNRCHYTLPENRGHFILPVNRAHYRIPEDD